MARLPGTLCMFTAAHGVTLCSQPNPLNLQSPRRSTPPDRSSQIQAIASINYTISEFPSHPTLPYDSIRDHHSDRAREAVHPQHVSDVLHALSFLRSFGLAERSYILSGHSCGACLAFQAILQPPTYYGLMNVVDAPCPAAIVGLNGLYDLPALVDGLGSSHEHLRGDYETLLSKAFGKEKKNWAAASPARFNTAVVSPRVREDRAPQLILLDQSMEDQLVPYNQLERFEADLSQSEGLPVIRGHRCTGKHAAPWEQGVMIWESVQDTLTHLRENLPSFSVKQQSDIASSEPAGDDKAEVHKPEALTSFVKKEL